MKAAGFACAIALMIACASQAGTVTLTFDDVPDGTILHLHYSNLGVAFMDSGTVAVDHSSSVWGPPHSGRNVLTWTLGGELPQSQIDINKGWQHPPSASSRAAVVGAYFSTQPGAVVQLLGYHSATYEAPVASVTIGVSENSWNNVYAQIASPAGIGFVRLVSVTPHGLNQLCADDMTIEFVPEPSTLASLSLALAGVGIGVARRRR